MSATPGRTRRAGSLSRRLLLLLIGGVSLCWVLAGTLTYHLASRQVDRLYDEDMIDFGEAALRLVDVAGGQGELIARSRKAIEGLPLVCRAIGLPPSSPGEKVRVAFGEPDLWEANVTCRYLGK